MKQKQIVLKVTGVLEKIIKENLDSFRKEESFKVRPGYGYDKFYLDWVEGSYDMSLQSLIHYILYEEGVYKKILSAQEYADMESVVREYPESLYKPDMDENEELLMLLDEIYWESIRFVGERLVVLGFNVEDEFAEYMEN